MQRQWALGDHGRAFTRSPVPPETPIPERPQPDLQLNLTLTLVIAEAWELSARNPGKPPRWAWAPGASACCSL